MLKLAMDSRPALGLDVRELGTLYLGRDCAAALGRLGRIEGDRLVDLTEPRLPRVEVCVDGPDHPTVAPQQLIPGGGHGAPRGRTEVREGALRRRVAPARER